MSSSTPPLSIPPPWTPQLDKLFEKALAIYDGDSADRWDKISSMVPGVDSSEVKRHYDRLVEDLNSIETGRVALPNYQKLSQFSSSDEDSPTARKGQQPAGTPAGGHGYGTSPGVSGMNAGGSSITGGSGAAKGSSSKSTDPERRKGIPWSEEEHRLFLLGLAKFGKGDWRSISRNFVISRTPTQVASHAQKYFIRLNSINNKDKRRSSIHDITSVNDGDSLPQSPGPITGLPSPNAQWPRAGLHGGGGMYDMSRMGGHGDHQMGGGGQMLMSPGGHPHHVPYGHVPVLQAPPMTMPHMSYASMPQSANA